MLIDFNEVKEIHMPGMNNGTGEMTARMYMDDKGKIIHCAIHAGGSIGMHSHPTSDDINYILSGTGKAVCDGQKKSLIRGLATSVQKDQSIVSSTPEMKT